MDGEIMKQIKLRNYIILAIIILVTIALVFIIKKAYENSQMYAVHTNERLSMLYEIKEDDLDSYLVENQDIVIYISNAKDEKIEEFEKELMTYISEKELAREIIYLNLDTVSSNFYKNIENKYFSPYLNENKTLLPEQANMLQVQEGKITKILYDKETSISMSDVKEFLIKNDVVSE
jgi:hypothetical protein